MVFEMFLWLFRKNSEEQKDHMFLLNISNLLAQTPKYIILEG